MSDLRTRIAAALRTADRRVAGFIGYDEMADAVIAELGLREEHRERSYGNWPNQPQVIYRKQRRYTSDWKNDE